MTALAPVLQAFFTDRLMTRQRRQPAHHRRLPRHPHGCCWPTSTTTGKPPAQLDLADLDAVTIGEFLHHLETERGNSVATRNTRLAAIHSLFRYAACAQPEHADLISRVLAIPTKRRDRDDRQLPHRTEIDALFAAPDSTTWHGRRDHALLRSTSRPDYGSPKSPASPSSDVHLGDRCARPLPRQRPQGAVHPTDHAHRHGPAHLARRTRRPAAAAPCSPPAAADGSPATPSSASSPSTPPPPRTARRCRASTSPHTPCGTPPR